MEFRRGINLFILHYLARSELRRAIEESSTNYCHYNTFPLYILLDDMHQ